MNLKIGDSANIMHFSSSNNYNVRIVQVDDLIIHFGSFKIKKETGIKIGDPAVLIYGLGPDVAVKGCLISQFSREDETLVVLCDDGSKGGSKRAFERYPVSYDSDLKLINESKRYSTIIKDISKYGFKILSDIEVKLNQKIEIIPYLNKKIAFITGRIIRCEKKPLYYEYGVNIEKIGRAHV